MAKIKIADDLFEILMAGATTAGNASRAVFVAHALGGATAGAAAADEQAQAQEKLKGLGYIG